MEIPLNAQVECTDGVCGHSVYVLINPIIDQVTFLIVKEDTPPNTEYMVPVEFVAETIVNTIRLSCDLARLRTMDPFVQTEFIQENKFRWVNWPYTVVHELKLQMVTLGTLMNLWLTRWMDRSPIW